MIIIWVSSQMVFVPSDLICTGQSWCSFTCRLGGEGDDRGRDGWMASPTRWAWVRVDSGRQSWTGRPGVLCAWGCKASDMMEQLNWTEPFYTNFCSVAQLCPTLCDPRTVAHYVSLSITNCRSVFKLKSIESVRPSNHLVLCRPLLLPP